MTIFFGIIIYLLFITLFLGLIKPSLAIPWSKKPTRLKVLGLWLMAFLGILTLSSLLEKESYQSDEKIKSATNQIENNNHLDTISTLSKTEKSDSLFLDAKHLTEKAESITRLKEEDKNSASALTEENEEKISNQIEQLRKEINSIQKGLDFSFYKESIDNLSLEIVLFAVYAKIVFEGINANNSEVKHLATTLKTEVEKIQVKEFPRMRKAYALISNSLLQEHKVSVSTSGNKNEILEVSGSVFGSETIIEFFHKQLKDSPKLFRFKEVRYKRHENDLQYSYFTIHSDSDKYLQPL